MMKILLSLLFVLLSVPAFAQGIYLPVATGTVTQANMKISAVDGTAFVDFSEALSLYTSNFSSGEDSWTATRGAVTGNVDSISGADDWLRFTSSTATGVHFISRSTTPSLMRGMYYEFTITYYIPVTNSHIVSFRIAGGDGEWVYQLTGVGNAVVTCDTVGSVVTATYIAKVQTTASGLRLYLNDGVSFTDPGGDDVVYVKDINVRPLGLTKRLGNLLVVRDSSGRAIQGFIKAAGTAETEGAEINSGTLVAQTLYKITATELSHFGTGYVVGSYFTALGSETCDANNKVTQVLTPSATGVTITSTKGGTTFNWAQKNSAFNYNDPNGYTYQIYKVLDAPVVASGSITAGDALIDATTANAFAAPVGVDLSAYQTGKHLLALYDSSGYAAIGWISATAPSGEELTELLTGWNFTSGWTATSATIIDANTFTVQAVNGGRLQSSGVVLGVGALYKGAFSATITNGSVALFDSYVSASTGLFIPSTGANTYRSAVSIALLVYSYTTTVGSTVDVSSMSLSRVTMPAATGALLLSTKGGSRGWIYKHASFNPNAAMTYKVLYVGD